MRGEEESWGDFHFDRRQNRLTFAHPLQALELAQGTIDGAF
jgi:hypothetical protein